MKFATIFDMDGVLVETHDLIWNPINKVLEKYDVHLTPEDINQYIGRSLEDDVKDWNKKYNLSLNLQEYRKSLWEEQKKLLKHIKANENLVSLLNELENNCVPKGIGTSSGTERAKKILRWTDLSKYFPVIVGAEHVHNHKPAPDVFYEVARKLNTPPEKCVVIEDSYLGILAAKIANMRAIGYLGKNNSFKDLIDADLVIKDFSEINYKKISTMFDKDFKPNNHAFSNETNGNKLFI